MDGNRFVVLGLFHTAAFEWTKSRVVALQGAAFCPYLRPHADECNFTMPEVLLVS